jgi:hypothetical protein
MKGTEETQLRVCTQALDVKTVQSTEEPNMETV